MTKIGKELLSQLTSENVEGPFVTIMLNTHVGHQNIEKDQIKLKNFAREAKKRFDKKYPEKDWSKFQEKFDALLADQSFWRSATTSAAIILTEKDTYIHRLSIAVDDQYYVGDLPYLLAIIKNAQFNYTYYLLGLNCDSMKLYFVENKMVEEVSLPEGAPVDVPTALGEELTDSSLNFSSQGGRNGSKEGVAFHGVSTKDEEVEIDWVNYYQAVDNFLKDEFVNEEEYPIYLYALPENQAMFKKYAKNPCYCAEPAVTGSAAQSTIKDIKNGADQLTAELMKKEVAEYQKLMDRKFIDQLVDIKLAAKEGRISHLFIATSNLAPGFGDDPDTEYDHRQVLNTMADEVLVNGGKVFVLDQDDAPAQKSLVAILRY